MTWISHGFTCAPHPEPTSHGRRSLNHWTTREVPPIHAFKGLIHFCLLWKSWRNCAEWVTFPDNNLHPLRQMLRGHEIEWRPRQALGAEPSLFFLTSTLGFHVSRRKILFVDYPIGEFEALATSLPVLTQTPQLLMPSWTLSRALLGKKPARCTDTACNSPMGPTPLLKSWLPKLLSTSLTFPLCHPEWVFVHSQVLSFALLLSQSGSPLPPGVFSHSRPSPGRVGNSASTRTAASRPITVLCSFSEVPAICLCPSLFTSSGSGT